MIVESDGVILDYSRQQATSGTMQLLLDLAKRQKLTEKVGRYPSQPISPLRRTTCISSGHERVHRSLLGLRFGFGIGIGIGLGFGFGLGLGLATTVFIDRCGGVW